MPRIRPGLLVLAALCACGGTTTSYVYPDDLTHPNYVKRSKAVRQFVASGDASQLPGAFRLLTDDHAHIRAQAAAALIKLTPGQRDFGYKAYLPARERSLIAERWRAFWLARAGTGANGGDDGAAEENP